MITRRLEIPARCVDLKPGELRLYVGLVSFSDARRGPVCLTNAEIGACLGVHAGSVARHLATLEAFGLIRRESPRDCREFRRIAFIDEPPPTWAAGKGGGS